MSTVVFTFGRMNPPTRGHELLVSKVVETARHFSADHVVYLSQTQRPTTDPLDWNLKRRICETAFRGVNISKDITIRNPFIAFERLKDVYSDVKMVVGSDQKEEFYERFSPYAEHWDVGFEVISAGQRIVESEDVAGISATKMRQYAKENNKEAFYNGLPSTLTERMKRMVFASTRQGIRSPAPSWQKDDK